jgi:hypothetical protein
LLLIAYLFDLTAARTKYTVCYIIITFRLTREYLFFDINLPDLTATLPVLGTIGLILIVLEGSLELELNRSKGTDKKIIYWSFPSFSYFSFSLAYLLQYYGGYSFRDS